MKINKNIILYTMNTLDIKTSHYIIGAVGLVTALSWNSAIKESLNKCFPIPKEEVIANFIYAIVITVLLIFIINILPNTTSELPKSTQDQIEQEEMQEKILKRITRLELMAAIRK